MGMQYIEAKNKLLQREKSLPSLKIQKMEELGFKQALKG